MEKTLQQGMRGISRRSFVAVGAAAAAFAGAGAAAASEAGLKVALLEVSDALGGMGAISGGLLGCESHLQKEAGYDVSVGALYQAWKEYNHSFCYGPLVREIFSTSADAIQWLCDHGVELNVLEKSNQAAHASDPLKWQCYHMYRDYDGATAFETLTSGLAQAGCDIRYGARMTELVVSDGAVEGVIYEDSDGNRMQLGAKRVVLATGGFCGNDEMMQEVFGTSHISGCAVNDRGEGTTGAWAAGARKWNTNSALMHAGMPSAEGETIINVAVSGLLEVDAAGRRFCDETVTSSTCLWANANYSVGGNPFIVLDQKTVDAFAANEVTLAPLNTDTTPPAEDTSKIQYELDADVEAGTVLKADTLEGLAELAGFDAETLAATVARYNELVDGGEDLDYGKDPAYLAYKVEEGPFYALECCVAVLSTTGGLFVDPHMRALTAEMAAVPNLYCVGSMASGAYYGSLPGYPDYEGAALSFAFTPGYIAGKEAAEQLVWHGLRQRGPPQTRIASRGRGGRGVFKEKGRGMEKHVCEWGLSRRGFMTGAGVVAGAAASLLACSKGQADETAGRLDAAPEALNPQDYDYRSNSGDVSALFSPWKLGPYEASNRMVKSAAGVFDYPSDPGMPQYYGNFARGGVRVIWVEDVVDMYEHFSTGWKSARQESEAVLRATVEAVHAEGAFIGYQLASMGTSFSGFDSSVAGISECAVAADLTHDEVLAFQADCATAAKYLQEVGFDGVEINAAGNNIGQAFMSRMRNQRGDEFGPQSIENRARFVSGIIEQVKAACGKDFVVQVLVNALEENDESLGDNSLVTTIEESKELAKQFEAAGADALHVRLGPLGMHVCQFASDLYFSGYGIDGTTSYGTQFDFKRHWQGKLVANHSGCGMLLDVAREFKDALSIPVGTVTFMDPAHAPDLFNAAIAEGKADFLLMNRPLTVDPEYVNKLQEGRIDEIMPCCRCLHCHQDFDRSGEYSYACRVNPCQTRAYTDAMPEGYDPLPVEAPKKVMVVGAGPAGMEAARIAAQRGHDVTLYEKSSAVGGQLEFARLVKGPHENLGDLRDYYARQLELKGVKVVADTEVDAALIASEAPEVVVLACGGKRDTLGLQASGATKVIPVEDVMATDLGHDVTVVGANVMAVDVTMYLQAQGKNVTLVFPDTIDQLGKGHSNWVKTFTKPMIFARGTRAWPQARITAVGEGEITISGETGVDVTVPCDTVIEALDRLPNTELVDGLDGIQTYAVGDCSDPWNIKEAITSANLVARKI